MIFNKTLRQLTAQDIEALKDAGFSEQKILEYKRDLPGSSDTEKGKFLAGASSLANTLGGYLIYGVDAPDGVPVDAPGVAVQDLDAATRRLDSLLQSGIRPRLRYEILEIAKGQQKYFFLLSIPKSLAGPHQVVTNGKFYGRSSNGKYELDVYEIRDLFLQTESFGEKASQFRKERLDAIQTGHAFRPLHIQSAKLVIHGLPFVSFLERRRYPVLNLYRKGMNTLMPEVVSQWGTSRNYHGIIGTDFRSTYFQWFHNGCFEYVSSNHFPPDIFSPWHYEPFLVKYLPKPLKLAEELEIPTPFFIGISLLDVAPKALATKRTGVIYGKGSGMKDFILPEVALETYSDNLGLALKESLDLVWNEFDEPGSECIGPDGNLLDARS